MLESILALAIIFAILLSPFTICRKIGELKKQIAELKEELDAVVDYLNQQGSDS